MEYLGAWGTWKKLKSKISCRSPFNGLLTVYKEDVYKARDTVPYINLSCPKKQIQEETYYRYTVVLLLFAINIDISKFTIAP